MFSYLYAYEYVYVCMNVCVISCLCGSKRACCFHLIGQLVSALLHVWQLIAHVCVICHGCWMWGVEKVSNREKKILVGIRGGLEERQNMFKWIGGCCSTEAWIAWFDIWWRKGDSFRSQTFNLTCTYDRKLTTSLQSCSPLCAPQNNESTSNSWYQ